MTQPLHVVVMGVAGTGKSTLAAALHEQLGWPVADADDFHPAENLARMHSGTPLTDEDRWPWLASLAGWTAEHDRDGRSTVLSCSALRRRYRDVLRRDGLRTSFVHLTTDPDVVRDRLRRRSGGVPPSLLDSQLATLEPLADDEPGVTLDASRGVAELVAGVLRDR